MLSYLGSSRRGGAFFKLLLFLVIFAGVITAAWIFFMPMLLTSTLSKRTGFDVKVQSLTFNPFAANVSVSGLVINNPHTFPRKDYLDIRSFRVKAPLKTFFEKNPELDIVELDIEQITFVRNSDGTLNTALFYDRLFPTPKAPTPEEPAAKGQKGTAGKAPAPKPETPEAPQPKRPDFLIRRLDLRIDKVTTEDHLGKNPNVKDFRLGIDQVYMNVTDPKQLLRPSVMKALSPVATAITGLIPGSLGAVFNSAVDASAGSAKDSKKKSADPMKTISDTLEESRKP
jgi:hypothetical protein